MVQKLISVIFYLTKNYMKIFQFIKFRINIQQVQKPLRIRFDKVDEFIIALDGKIKHLILFEYGLFDKICDKIKYVISKKVVIQIALMIIL